MLLFFILFIFFILHIQFLVRNLLFGLDESTYFFWTVKYLFDQEVAQRSLLFAIACAGSFAICYTLFYRKRKKKVVNALVEVDLKHSRDELLLLNIMGMVQVVYGVVLVGISGFNYSVMVGIKENYGFIQELRIFYLFLLAHLLLNVPWKQVMERRELKLVRWVVVAYLLTTLFGQARSTLFELAAIIVFSQLMWTGDKVRLKYVLFLVGALLIPNLVVLGRIGIPDDKQLLIDGLFSFEYTILFNNMLSAAIDTGTDMSSGFTFGPSLQLLIPLPLRALFGLDVMKSTYYTDIADAAGVRGGGFSLLAEMYSNFGWFALVVFCLLGLLIGRMNSRAARVGRVSMLNAAAPLLYTYFILAFRNDFGVFLKQAVQLFIISLLLSVLLQSKIGKYYVDRI